MSRSKLAQGWQSRNAPRPGAGAGAGAGAGDADMPDSEAARAAALKNEYQEELNDARETKERIAQELVQLEKQLVMLEYNYLEESSNFGSVIHGFDNVLKPGMPDVPESFEAVEEDRVFSRSSITAPIASNQAAMAKAAAGAAARIAARAARGGEVSSSDDDSDGEGSEGGKAAGK